MAYIDFEDEQQRLLGQPPPGGSAAAPLPASAAAPQAGTGFVNFNTLLGLNPGGGEAMAGRVVGDLDARAGAVTRGAASLNAQAANAGQTGDAYNPAQAASLRGQASDVTARANVLGQSGPGASLAELYGGGRQYTSGEKAMDSALAGATSGGAMRTAAGRYGNFGALLGLDKEPPARVGGGGSGPVVGPGGGGLLGGGQNTDEDRGIGLPEDRRRRLREGLGGISDRNADRQHSLAKDPRANPFGAQDDMRDNPFRHLLWGF